MPSASSPRAVDTLPGRPTLVFPERHHPAAERAQPCVGGDMPAPGPVRGDGSFVGRGPWAGREGEGGGRRMTLTVPSAGEARSAGRGRRRVDSRGGLQTGHSMASLVCAVREGEEHPSPQPEAGQSRGRLSRLWHYVRYRVRQLVGHVEATPALTAAKTQRTPCGVNRFLLLGVYFLYAFLTARVYFAWPSLSNMLFRSNAYAWLCDPASPDLRLPENGGRRYRCEAQNSQVGSLFVTCLTFAFSCSLLAGILLDFFGPKITALTGQLCNMLSWLLLAFAGKHAQTYFPAFIFMGIGSDIGYLPVLSSANLFPGHEGLVVACLGAAKSMSFAIPAILDIVELRVEKASLQDVSLGYVAFGPGLCVLLSLLLIPLQAFVPWNEFVYLEEEPSMAAARPLVRVNDSFASYEAHAWRDSFSSFQDVKDWMHHHHLATPLEELTHSASCAALPPLRGQLLGGGLFPPPATAAEGAGGAAGSSSSSTGAGTGGAGVGGATGRILFPSPQDTTTAENKAKDSSKGAKEEGGTGNNSELVRGSGSTGGELTTLGTSVSTEAVFAVSGSSSSTALPVLRLPEDAARGLRHPDAPTADGDTPVESNSYTGEEEATADDADEGERQGKGGDGAEEEDDGEAALKTQRDVSEDIRGWRLPAAATDAAAAAKKNKEEQEGLGRRISDTDEAAVGEESAAATTGSETVAAAEEEVAGTPVVAGGEAPAEEMQQMTSSSTGGGAPAEELQRTTPSSAGEGGGEGFSAGGEGNSTAAGGGGRGRGAASAHARIGARRDGERGGSTGGEPPGAAELAAARAAAAAAAAREEESATPSFRKQFFSKFAFGIIFYSVLKALMYAFFTTGGENLLGKEVNDFLGAALPFSCIPCIFLGKAVDLIGIMPVLLLLNTCITLAYGFSMIPSTGTAYLGALLYICYVSFYSSQSYCYVSDTFSSCHFGKLVGTIHMIAGLLSLLKIPMQSMVVHVFHSNYLYPCIFMLAFCAANFAVLIWLVILKRHNPHPFWPQSARDTAAAENERRAAHRREQKRKRREMKERRRGRQHQTAQEDNQEEEEAHFRSHDQQQQTGERGSDAHSPQLQRDATSRAATAAPVPQEHV